MIPIRYERFFLSSAYYFTPPYPNDDTEELEHQAEEWVADNWRFNCASNTSERTPPLYIKRDPLMGYGLTEEYPLITCSMLWQCYCSAKKVPEWRA